MEIYIIEDDVSVIHILEDIIEDNDLGRVSGTTEESFEGNKPINIDEIINNNPDVVLVDFLMPGRDGVSVVKELREKGLHAKFIMISQVSAKELVGKAYESGVDFFISKPINIVEVKTVLKNTEEQLKNERTISNLKKMFLNEIAEMPKKNTEKDKVENAYGRKIQYILNKIGMSGEKGGEDIRLMCEYLHNNGKTISQVGIGELCSILSDTPKNMEQRARRAIAVGMSNLAHLGIEDFMNDTFTEYSSSLFPFEEIRAEMDFIRGKRRYGGKISIKKFLDSLMLQADRE